MIRDIPEFDLGCVTNGAGEPVEDVGIAYSSVYGLDRELELKGEGAIDLMPIIVTALNAYDVMSAALRKVRASAGWSALSDDDRQLVTAAINKAGAS